MKVKYGEIDADSNRDKEDSAVHNKVGVISVALLLHIQRRFAFEVSAGYDCV